MNDKWHFVTVTAIDIILGISTVKQIPALAILGFLFTMFVLLKGSKSQAFYTVLATSLFAGVYSIGSIGVYFLVLLAASLKISGSFNFGKYTLPVIGVLLIYCFHDLMYSTPGFTLIYFSCLFFLFSCFTHFDFDNYNHRYATLLFLTSIVIVQISAVGLFGDLSALSDESVENVRLGEGNKEEGANNNLDGAMGFPISSILFITLSIPLLFGNWLKKKYKLILATASIALFIVTFFTTSKVYLLGLLVLSLCLLLIFFRARLSATNRILFVGFILAAIFFLIRSGYVNTIIDRYTFRIMYDQNDITSSRSGIYEDCIQYLLNNPIALLFGNGYRGYSYIGQQLGYKFSMTAHNIFLDCIMAYGLLGFVLILNMGRNLFAVTKTYISNNQIIIGLIPMLCWLTMTQTNSAFMLPKTYALIPFLILNIQYYKKLQYAD